MLKFLTPALPARAIFIVFGAAFLVVSVAVDVVHVFCEAVGEGLLEASRTLNRRDGI